MILHCSILLVIFVYYILMHGTINIKFKTSMIMHVPMYLSIQKYVSFKREIRNCSNVDKYGNWTIRESLKCSDNNKKIVTFFIAV